MSIANNRMSRPITKADITTVWGSGTSLKTLLSGTVAKWSKYQGFPANARYTDFYDSANSARLAGAVAANFGLTIPSSANANAFHAALAGATAGSFWTRTRPSGVANDPIRVSDFDGYSLPAKQAQEWDLAGGSATSLNFPFAGNVYFPGGSTIGPGGTIEATMEPVDPDGGSQGLLYPTDFGLLDRYFGLAIISATGSWTADFYVTDSLTLRQRAAQGGSGAVTLTLARELSNGTYYVYPIIASKPTPSATSLMAAGNWTGESSAYIGRAISVDGYRLSFTYNASTPAFTVSFGTIYADGNTMKVPVTLRNTTGSAVTLSNVFTYIESEGVFDTSAEHAAVEAGTQAWVNSGTRYTGGISYGGHVVAEYKAQSAVTVPAGTTQTVTLTVSDSLADAQGYDYDDHSTVYLCVQQGSERKVY